MSLLAAFQRKLLKGDLLRDRDFTLPELEGVAGVELEPGAGWDKEECVVGNRIWEESRAWFFLYILISGVGICSNVPGQSRSRKVGEKENKMIQSNKKIILRGSKVQKHFSC